MRRVLVLIALATLAVGPPTLRAADVSVSAVVQPSVVPPTPPDTVVMLRGLAYPRAQVTVRRQGVILATVTADPTARFDISLANQPTGINAYTITAQDALGRPGHEENFILALTPGTTTTITGIFLGPTIQADKTEITVADTLTLTGVTAPQSEVSVFVALMDEVRREPPFQAPPNVQHFRTTADPAGLWVRQILGADLTVGDHGAGARSVAPSAEISSFSSPVFFRVLAAAPPSEDACSDKNRADINCDGLVNLTDFSILLYFWRQTAPANPRADLNGDGIVNLTDFSILLFNWTR